MFKTTIVHIVVILKPENGKKLLNKSQKSYKRNKCMKERYMIYHSYRMRSENATYHTPQNCHHKVKNLHLSDHPHKIIIFK